MESTYTMTMRAGGLKIKIYLNLTICLSQSTLKIQIRFLR